VESEYDRLTRRSFELKQRLDQAEQRYQEALHNGEGVLAIARRRRDMAMSDYQAIEAQRKRAAAPPNSAID
jgi:hypothetical protein